MKRFVVLGGGIAGLCTARLLARRGFEVALLEKRRLGAGATGKAAGILNLPLAPRSAFQKNLAASFAGYAGFIRELEEESGTPIELQRCGMLYPAFTDEEERRLAGLLEQARALQPEAGAAWRERSRILEDIPDLHPGIRGGLFLASVARVHPADLVNALRASLVSLGVRIEEESGADLPARIEAAHCIACAGAWTTEVLGQFGVSPPAPVVPIKGQMIEIAAPFHVPCMLRLDDHYIIPRPGGRLWVGSTVEDRGFDEEVTEAGKDELFQVAARLLPALRRDAIAGAWAGLRPKTLRRGGAIVEPFAAPRLSILAGHYRSGILAAPHDAERLVRELAGAGAGD